MGLLDQGWARADGWWGGGFQAPGGPVSSIEDLYSFHRPPSYPLTPTNDFRLLGHLWLGTRLTPWQGDDGLDLQPPARSPHPTAGPVP